MPHKTNTTTTTATPNPSNPLPTRIAQSATSLTRTALHQHPTSASTTLAATLQAQGKSHSSSSSSSSPPSSSLHLTSPTTTSRLTQSFKTPPPALDPSTAFSDFHDFDGTDNSESDVYFASYLPAPDPLGEASTGNGDGKGKGKGKASLSNGSDAASWRDEFLSPHPDPGFHSISGDVAVVEEGDGAAVRDLLAQPLAEEDLASVVADDAGSDDMAGLFGPGDHGSREATREGPAHPSRPDIDALLPRTHTPGERHISDDELDALASRILQEWEAATRRYVVDVWDPSRGEKMPEDETGMMETARRDADVLREGLGDGTGKGRAEMERAVRRLGLVVGHLGGRGGGAKG